MITVTPAAPEAPGVPLAGLPQLPIGALAVGLAELLQAAADLPQPALVTLSVLQDIGLLFPSDHSSLAALTAWAQRFASVLASDPSEDGRIYCRTTFSYFGVTVDAYAFIPPDPSRP